MAEKLVWGIMGAANIAIQKVVPGMLKDASSTVRGFASRDATKAAAASEHFGLATSYGSYEALLEDPEIEAVYIPLPNHLHVPWSLKALAAGKHVLCEKPIALDADEAAQLVAAREKSGRQVLEAFMVRQHPQWLRVREIAASGEIGDVALMQTTLSYYNVDPNNVRNKADIGGGALYDVGCYAVLLSRFVFGSEPLRAVALVDRDPVLETDRLTGAILDFGDGRQLSFATSTQLVPFQRTQILGSRGRIEVPVSLNAPQGETTAVVVDLTGAIDGSGIRTETIAACDQYTLQTAAAVRIFRGEEQPEFPIEDAVLNMRAIDALYRSGRSGGWETI
ncbi:deoxyfructose oxidoreductase [Aureimonas sp. SA4125]|uniref:Gfo/Idh/MocA family protein n=1 Tax=Aureimonas sp. SA4125 TaxID=2826993 RepID=UPI001CC359D3|nr:Gfo/Idh/MocA family oxidoreductase [Aureimonas sp. SA4125]BDA86176.1 deoxyfructose oxidoreductase [Aureimonas sp. SA4125]